jgi:hypothetical protein
MAVHSLALTIILITFASRCDEFLRSALDFIVGGHCRERSGTRDEAVMEEHRKRRLAPSPRNGAWANGCASSLIRNQNGLLFLLSGRTAGEGRNLDITLAPFDPISAAHLGAEQGGKAPPPHFFTEAVVEGSGETQEQIGLFCFTHTGRGKQRQVLPTGPPIVFVVAVVTEMERVTIGDPQQAATRVAKAHVTVLIEGGDARQLLVGEVSANPLTDDLLGFS